MRIWNWAVFGAVMLGFAVLAYAEAEAQTRKPPYYASISASRARMRTGPGRNYPASWLYLRADLPIRVIDIYGNWRKIEDPDGTQGWMLVNLLSATRTAMVVGRTTEMREAPRLNARINWRAEAGVGGRSSICARGGGWCDVRGRGGYVEQSRLGGVDPGEVVG